MKKQNRLGRVFMSILIIGLTIALSVPSFAAGNAKRGKRKYNQFCTPCHGKLGNGQGTRATVENLDPRPRNHTDGKYMNKRTDVQLFKTIKEGGKSMNFSHIMPQWKHILKDRDIWDVIAHVRSLAVPAYTGQPSQEGK